jgi:hypothetical protein
VAATYRDTARASPSDPWQPLWPFRECPGYEEVASFEASPYETDLAYYSTWPGRVGALVLRAVGNVTK